MSRIKEEPVERSSPAGLVGVDDILDDKGLVVSSDARGSHPVGTAVPEQVGGVPERSPGSRSREGTDDGILTNTVSELLEGSYGSARTSASEGTELRRPNDTVELSLSIVGGISDGVIRHKTSLLSLGAVDLEGDVHLLEVRHIEELTTLLSETAGVGSASRRTSGREGSEGTVSLVYVPESSPGVVLGGVISPKVGGWVGRIRTNVRIAERVRGGRESFVNDQHLSLRTESGGGRQSSTLDLVETPVDERHVGNYGTGNTISTDETEVLQRRVASVLGERIDGQLWRIEVEEELSGTIVGKGTSLTSANNSRVLNGRLTGNSGDVNLVQGLERNSRERRSVDATVDLTELSIRRFEDQEVNVVARVEVRTSNGGTLPQGIDDARGGLSSGTGRNVPTEISSENESVGGNTGI